MIHLLSLLLDILYHKVCRRQKLWQQNSLEWYPIDIDLPWIFLQYAVLYWADVLHSTPGFPFALWETSPRRWRPGKSAKNAAFSWNFRARVGENIYLSAAAEKRRGKKVMNFEIVLSAKYLSFQPWKRGPPRKRANRQFWDWNGIWDKCRFSSGDTTFEFVKQCRIMREKYH